MIRIAAPLLALALRRRRASANDLAKDLAPTGTLRATYIATNPVQAFVDPATKEVRGPAAAIAAELAKRAGVPVTVTGAQGVQGVIDSVKNGHSRHRLRGVRSGARRAGRFLAELCAGAEHLHRRGQLADQDPSRMRIARACASASARAMPATTSSPAR